jgi:hypothetical protein
VIVGVIVLSAHSVGIFGSIYTLRNQNEMYLHERQMKREVILLPPFDSKCAINGVNLCS